MDELIVLINFEDKSVVDVEFSKDLHCNSSPTDDETNQERQVVNIDSWCKLFQMWFTLMLILGWDNSYEYKYGDHWESCSQEESNYEKISSSYWVLRSIKLQSCWSKIALTEAICVKFKQVVWQNLKFLTHFIFMSVKGLWLNDVAKLLIKSVVFDSEKIFRKLFHNFS